MSNENFTEANKFLDKLAELDVNELYSVLQNIDENLTEEDRTQLIYEILDNMDFSDSYFDDFFFDDSSYEEEMLISDRINTEIDPRIRMEGPFEKLHLAAAESMTPLYEDEDSEIFLTLDEALIQSTADLIHQKEDYSQGLYNKIMNIWENAFKSIGKSI